MISLIPLRENSDVDLNELGDQMRDLLGEDTIVRLADEGGTVIAEVAGVSIKASLRNHPIPVEILQEPLKAAWYWSDAESEINKHSSYFIVVISDPRIPEPPKMEPAEVVEETPNIEGEGVLEIFPETPDAPPLDDSVIRYSVQGALLLTRISLLLGNNYGALGIYWDGSTALHSWKAFEESCASMTPVNLPLRIWIDFRLWESKDGTRGLVTHGMTEMGQRELEIIGSSSSAQQIRAWSYTVAHYCLEKGKVLEHGQAVGISPKEWIRTWIVKSRLDPGTWATWLDLEAEE
ncbi:MAG TPA: hypothetical protein DGU45_02940 [Planctomycetes bacterium]|nr:hypothetical protein [Planctomycetota bacterium]